MKKIAKIWKSVKSIFSIWEKQKSSPFVIASAIIFGILLSLTLNARNNAIEAVEIQGYDVVDTRYEILASLWECPSYTAAYSYTATDKDGKEITGTMCCRITSGLCIESNW